MSHVLKIGEMPIKDLECLGVAAEELGGELMLNQKDHLYYAGQRKKCDHAIRVVGVAGAYEIGVIRNAAGEYELHADFYQGGKGLVNAFGEGAKKLYKHYKAEAAAQDRRRLGYRVTKQIVENRLVIHAVK